MNQTDHAFVEAAKDRILAHLRKRRQAGLYDTIVAVVRSSSGTLYEGIPFETDQSQFDCCAERHALNCMHYAEPDDKSFDALLVAGPVLTIEAEVTTPCGACRQAMYSLAPDASVYCTNFVRDADGWSMFPSIEKYTVAELFPNHNPLPTWD